MYMEQEKHTYQTIVHAGYGILISRFRYENSNKTV